MDKTPLHNPQRFQDPLGDYMKAAQTSAQRRLESFPAVEKVYKGFYAEFEPHDKEGASFLNGSEGIIGTEFVLQQDDKGQQDTQDYDRLALFTSDNRCIAFLDKRLSAELLDLLARGWVVRCKLAFIIFVAEKKTFSAQIACFCYSPELSKEQNEAIESFIRNITDRIASAFHPSLSLNQEQFVKVLESKGEWFLTKNESWPALPKGSIYFRRRRTFNDKLISAALKGNKGCTIASWVATVVILAGIAFAIWFFFFSN